MPKTEPGKAIRVTYNQKDGTWKKNSAYWDDVNALSTWLIENPDFNIWIFQDAGLKTKKWFGVTQDWENSINLTGTTYGERVDDVLKNIKADVIKKGNGEISNDRIKTRRGELNLMEESKNKVRWSRKTN
jgi:hypothetical protein